jgi:hypothetical protein
MSTCDKLSFARHPLAFARHSLALTCNPSAFARHGLAFARDRSRLTCHGLAFARLPLTFTRDKLTFKNNSSAFTFNNSAFERVPPIIVLVGEACRDVGYKDDKICLIFRGIADAFLPVSQCSQPKERRRSWLVRQ